MLAHLTAALLNSFPQQLWSAAVVSDHFFQRTACGNAVLLAISASLCHHTGCIVRPT
jgi:hypothetical protein